MLSDIKTISLLLLSKPRPQCSIIIPQLTLLCKMTKKLFSLFLFPCLSSLRHESYSVEPFRVCHFKPINITHDVCSNQGMHLGLEQYNCLFLRWGGKTKLVRWLVMNYLICIAGCLQGLHPWLYRGFTGNRRLFKHHKKLMKWIHWDGCQAPTIFVK